MFEMTKFIKIVIFVIYEHKKTRLDNSPEKGQ